MDRQPGELLERIEYFAAAADQFIQVVAAVDADDRSFALDVEIDVAVEVQQVQQLFQIVAGYLSFGDQSLLQVLPFVGTGVCCRRLLGFVLDRKLGIQVAFGGVSVRHSLSLIHGSVPVSLRSRSGDSPVKLWSFCQLFRFFGRAPGRGVRFPGPLVPPAASGLSGLTSVVFPSGTSPSASVFGVPSSPIVDEPLPLAGVALRFGLAPGNGALAARR